MQIGILGPLEVRDGERIIPVAGARLRRLLTRLALDAPGAVSTTALVGAVWPDGEPSDVANALQSLVSRLRRALGDPGRVVQVPSGYRLDLPSDAVDAHVFGSLVASGRRQLRSGNPAGAVCTLARALELWRGVPLADADQAEYAVAPVTRLEEQRLAAVGDRIDAELAEGNADEQIPQLEELVAAYPQREQFVGQLMTALAIAGRTAEALAAYQQLRERLGDELGVDPGPETQAVHLKILRGEPLNDLRADARPAHRAVAPADESADEPASPPRAARTNLRMAVSSFIGRQAEMSRISSLIETSRLATIVGPGGAGKTRLATEAARPWVDRCADGVWLVELASVTDESTIAQAVLSALGLRDSRIIERRAETGFGIGATERVFETLAESDALLVMDNCEHLIGAVADLVAEILARCPGVRMLTTSREPLGIPGEALASIPPLGLPPVGVTPEQAADYPAVQLLVARGQAASAGLVLDDETVVPVVEIVRRLDGLPLAIELAAARLRVLPVAEIASRLGDRFRLLAGGMRTAVARHRTLRAVVEWSWELLTDAERLLAERLSVFAAGATVDAAVEVCAGHGLDALDVPDLLIALVDKSLLGVDARRGVRYRMLETIREYGVERLDERDELGAARSAHARYYAVLAERLDPKLRTSDQLVALAELSAEHDNILASLRYLGDSGDGPRTLRLIQALGWYWNVTGAHTEMLTWIEFGLAATEGVTSLDRMKLEAGRVLASISTEQDGAWDRIQERMAEVAETFAAIDDGTDVTTRLARLVAAFFGARPGEIDFLLEDGRRSPDPWIRAVTLSTHLMMLENLGEVEDMRAETDEAFEAFSALGDRWGLSNVLTVRAGVRAADGDVDGAAADYQQALAYLTELGATEDDLLIQLRLAGLRLRSKDFAGAREHIDAARRGTVNRPTSVERTLLADVALIGVAVVEGDLGQAEDLSVDLRGRMAGLPTVNAMFGHMVALTGSSCAMVAVRSGSLDTAHDDLAQAYPAAVATQDRPVLASVGVVVAAYAGALGRNQDAAEILGAAATLRGHDDSSDVMITMVRSQVVDALGVGAFERSYARGRSLGQDAAAQRLDPAALDA